MEIERLPRIFHFQIVDCPSLDKLLESLKGTQQALRFKHEPHTKDSASGGGTLICGLHSLSVPDRNGMRRVELWTSFYEDCDLYFVGRLNTETRLGTGTLEKRAKPRPPAEPVEYLIGDKVHILGQTPTP